MKNIVINEQYSQADIKPSGLLHEYIALLAKDAAQLLQGPALKTTACPSCSSEQTSKHFEKFGFTYRECARCQSLYVSPRPSADQLFEFYKKAPSKIYWRNQLSEASRQSRKAKIIKPRFEWVGDSAAEYFPGASHWVDLHTAQQRYVEAMASSGIKYKTLVGPYCDVGKMDGVDVVSQPWWDAKLSRPADIVTAFEVMDHAYQPAALLDKIRAMLNPGGLCFLTCILSSGFDIKEMGEHAANIFPPDRLNVLSAQGLKKLVEDGGFECLEFSTPGILDVDLAAAVLKGNPAACSSAFIRDLVLNAGDDVRRSFQDFLQANLLSSYGRMLIRKA